MLIDDKVSDSGYRYHMLIIISIVSNCMGLARPRDDKNVHSALHANESSNKPRDHEVGEGGERKKDSHTPRP